MGIVRGCPLGTGQGRREWHARGTASENDVAQARSAPPSSAVDQDRLSRPATSSIIKASPMPTIQASLARGMPC
jgi:hypothetical protein